MPASTIGPAENLQHPKLLIDPRSGNPHVFATDLNSCLFQIFELVPMVEEEDRSTTQAPAPDHHPAQASTVALRPDLPLATKIEVGSGLKLIMHWDGDEENRSIPRARPGRAVRNQEPVLDETLSHEQAVELIRELAR